MKKGEVCICGILHDLRIAGDISEHLQQPRSGCPQVTEHITNSTVALWTAIFSETKFEQNSTIAWSQVQDERGGGLGMGLATPPSKKKKRKKRSYATETATLFKSEIKKVELSELNCDVKI